MSIPSSPTLKDVQAFDPFESEGEKSGGSTATTFWGRAPLCEWNTGLYQE